MNFVVAPFSLLDQAFLVLVLGSAHKFGAEGWSGMTLAFLSWV